MIVPHDAYHPKRELPYDRKMRPRPVGECGLQHIPQCGAATEPLWKHVAHTITSNDPEVIILKHGIQLADAHEPVLEPRYVHR